MLCSVRPHLLCLFALVGCATQAYQQSTRQAPTSCSTTDSAAAATIRQRLAEWLVQTNTGDQTAANTIWAPEVVGWFPSGREFSDSAAFAVADVNTTTFRSTFQLRVDDVAVQGSLAAVHDVWKETRQFPGLTVTVSRVIRGSEMWRCQSDGSWRIVRWVSAPEHWVRGP